MRIIWTNRIYLIAIHTLQVYKSIFFSCERVCNNCAIFFLASRFWLKCVCTLVHQVLSANSNFWMFIGVYASCVMHTSMPHFSKKNLSRALCCNSTPLFHTWASVKYSWIKCQSTFSTGLQIEQKQYPWRSNLLYYKTLGKLTWACMFSEMVVLSNACCIWAESAWWGGGHRLLKTSDMCSGCPTGSMSVFRAGGEEIVGVMQFGRILINWWKIPHNVLKSFSNDFAILWHLCAAVKQCWP